MVCSAAEAHGLLSRKTNFGRRTVGRIAYFAGQNWKSECIALKICTVRFSGFLIMNLTLDLSNLKWRTQNYWCILKKLRYCRESIYCKLFGVADYELDIRFVKFKIADPKWRTYCEKKSYCPEIMYYKLFGVAAYKSDIKFIKFKMADPKWRTYLKKNSYGSEST
jgi:hypothetical protein